MVIIRGFCSLSIECLRQGRCLQNQQQGVDELGDFAQAEQCYPVIVELHVAPAASIRGLGFCFGVACEMRRAPAQHTARVQSAVLQAAGEEGASDVVEADGAEQTEGKVPGHGDARKVEGHAFEHDDLAEPHHEEVPEQDVTKNECGKA